MPVRIIFRGLILFDVQKEGREDGTITAYLIDGSHAPPAMRAMHGAAAEANDGAVTAHDGAATAHDSAAADHGEMHKHKAEVQIFTGQSANAEAKSLNLRGKLDLTVTGVAAVRRDDSYKVHCPSLAKIAASAGLGARRDTPDAEFVSHTVTVNRGTIRVRDLVSWDAGAPELPTRLPSGVHVPAWVRFLGTNVQGYMASECVIDVLDASEIHVSGSNDHLNTPKDTPLKGVPGPSLRVPPDMVEILITNFAPQRTFALPWTLHYRWMFDAMGYTPVPLDQGELEKFGGIVSRYNSGVSPGDIDMFFDADGKTGFPFPYFNPEKDLVSVNPVTTPAVGTMAMQDPWDREMCPLGDITTTGS